MERQRNPETHVVGSYCMAEVLLRITNTCHTACRKISRGSGFVVHRLLCEGCHQEPNKTDSSMQVTGRKPGLLLYTPPPATPTRCALPNTDHHCRNARLYDKHIQHIRAYVTPRRHLSYQVLIGYTLKTSPTPANNLGGGASYGQLASQQQGEEKTHKEWPDTKQPSPPRCPRPNPSPT